jgi:hypothetical protein
VNCAQLRLTNQFINFHQTPEECPSDTEVPLDTCIETSLNDGSYFLWNSSYCNSTELPELIPDWYTIYSFREVCNLANPALILEGKMIKGFDYWVIN